MIVPLVVWDRGARGPRQFDRTDWFPFESQALPRHARGRCSVRSWFASEDWFAVWLGLAVVLLALPTAAGVDLLGWIAAPRVWLYPLDAVRPVSPKFAAVPGLASLLFTYLLVLGLVGACAAVRKIELRSFIPSFTLLFWLSALSMLVGHYAYIAQTPDKRAGMGITWSLGLTGEAGYLVALAGGAAGREFLSGGRGLAEAGGQAGVVHQDRDRAAGSGARRQGGRCGRSGLRRSCFAVWRRSSRLI